MSNTYKYVRIHSRECDKYHHPYDVAYTNSVGLIVYEDAWQVAVKIVDGKMLYA